MKLKILLIGSLLCLLVFLIYLANKDTKLYYLNLGDSIALGVTPYGTTDYGYADTVKDYLEENGLLEKYVSSFAKKGYRTTDMIHAIEENKEEDGISIQNALIKADIVTLSIGSLDFYSRMDLNPTDPSISYEYLYEFVDEAMLDLQKLLSLLRSYSKETILMLGYYNPSTKEEGKEFYKYLNRRIRELCDEYNIGFVDVATLVEDNVSSLPNPKDIHLSKEAYQKIGEEILRLLFQKEEK